jgi:hypothetical protein
MTTRDLHILIEQDVQKISSFAYEDLLPEEIDIQANKSYYEFLNDFAQFQPRGNRFNDTEARMNDIRTLIVRETPLDTVRTGGVSVASLPSSYLYLVGLKAETLAECSLEYAVTVEPNKFYILKSDTITIEGDTYTKGQVVTVTVPYTAGSTKFIELTKQTIPCRIVTNEEYEELEQHHYGKSKYMSPLAVISSEGITLSTKDFFINKVYLTYIKKPNVINIASPSAELQLPINSAYKLAKLTVNNILQITEQSQQKITNLQSEIK